MSPENNRVTQAALPGFDRGADEVTLGSSGRNLLKDSQRNKPGKAKEPTPSVCPKLETPKEKQLSFLGEEQGEASKLRPFGTAGTRTSGPIKSVLEPGETPVQRGFILQKENFVQPRPPHLPENTIKSEPRKKSHPPSERFLTIRPVVLGRINRESGGIKEGEFYAVPRDFGLKEYSTEQIWRDQDELERALRFGGGFGLSKLLRRNSRLLMDLKPVVGCATKEELKRTFLPVFGSVWVWEFSKTRKNQNPRLGDKTKFSFLGQFECRWVYAGGNMKVKRYVHYEVEDDENAGQTVRKKSQFEKYTEKYFKAEELLTTRCLDLRKKPAGIEITLSQETQFEPCHIGQILVFEGDGDCKHELDLKMVLPVADKRGIHLGLVMVEPDQRTIEQRQLPVNTFGLLTDYLDFPGYYLPLPEEYRTAGF